MLFLCGFIRLLKKRVIVSKILTKRAIIFGFALDNFNVFVV